MSASRYRTVALVLCLASSQALAQRTSVQHLRPAGVAEVRDLDAFVAAAARTGQLRASGVSVDPALPGRTIERFEQFTGGLRVFGAQIVRDSASGMAQSLFGTLYQDCAPDTAPTLSSERAAETLARQGGAGAQLLGRAELLVLPLDSGECRLAYSAVVGSPADVVRLFVDAHSGALLLTLDEIQRQAAVGTGVGVLGDTKKVSARREAAAFYTDDALRPPLLTTYDMRGNVQRVLTVLNGGPLFASDRGVDDDNTWNNAAIVDAHAHIGWSYDYYFKRFGRRGFNDADRAVTVLTNGVTQAGALSLPPDLFGLFVVNAFWCGSCGPAFGGAIFFGNGIPPGFSIAGNNYTYFAGALDIVAHEYTHAVTDSTSRLIYRGESGALNEAFSDIMGTSIEFYHQPAGAGLGRADYSLGEDISRAIRPGAIDGDRSLENPRLHGDPDHYSGRYTGSEDGGGVHTNSMIAGHAFYLAIEGGTNRTSGLAVQGVGATNREQIEKVFYRAFTLLLPSAANFSTARAATIQAARDLYGAGSASERAVTQAWTAVGVL